MTRLLPAALLALLLAAPALPEPAAADPGSRAQWEQRVRSARRDLAEAKARYAELQMQYTRARKRRRVRGEEKAQLQRDLTQARLAVEEAEARLEALPEEARRAGVPPGWLRVDGEDPASVLR